MVKIHSERRANNVTEQRAVYDLLPAVSRAICFISCRYPFDIRSSVSSSLIFFLTLTQFIKEPIHFKSVQIVISTMSALEIIKVVQDAAEREANGDASAHHELVNAVQRLQLSLIHILTLPTKRIV